MNCHIRAVMLCPVVCDSSYRPLVDKLGTGVFCHPIDGQTGDGGVLSPNRRAPATPPPSPCAKSQGPRVPPPSPCAKSQGPDYRVVRLWGLDSASRSAPQNDGVDVSSHKDGKGECDSVPVPPVPPTVGMTGLM